MIHSTRMPSVYIPHGGGPAFFMQGEMRELFQPMADFLASMDGTLPARPSAILVVTAHWETAIPTFTGGPAPDLIYDYYGFPDETYSLSYPASGDPLLTERASRLLSDAQIDNRVDTGYGWDHGVFIPLKVIYPEAGIPVVAMSLRNDMDPAAHVAIGRALMPLRDEGVLILGSGMSYHNLSRISNGKDASVAFDRWLDDALAGNAAHRSRQLARWSEAPSAREAHPREEHMLPLMVVSGSGSDLPAKKIWRGAVGSSRVSAWAFD